MELEKVIQAINNNEILFDNEQKVIDKNGLRIFKNNEEVFLLVNEQKKYNGSDAITFYALKEGNSVIKASDIGCLTHYHDDEEYYRYYLSRIEITNKDYFGKKISAYAMKYFFEIAIEKGYSKVWLNYRPQETENENMYIINEKGQREHRASYLYHKNGFAMSFDDRGSAQFFKTIYDNELKQIKDNTIITNGVKVYKDIKTWTKINKEKTME